MFALTMAWLMLTPVVPAALSIGAPSCEPLPVCADAVIPSLARLADPAERFPTVRLELPADTPQQKLFEYSDQYTAQLTLHRLASYATLPLFAIEVVAGQALLSNRDHPPGWAKAVHGPAAGALAGLFILNTVTGTLNIIEAMPDPEGRGRRILHGLLMIAADAGFAATGITAAKAGRFVENTNQVKTKHRTIALSSMGVATVGYLIMLPWFRD
jgi:hypothetical protein